MPRDTTSFSNCEDVYSTHLDLQWQVDFDRKVIVGSVKHTLQVVNPIQEVIFDTNGLNVSRAVIIDKTKVVLAEEDLKFKLDAHYGALGSKLTVMLPRGGSPGNTVLNITIYYTTAPDASAIQWADAEATADKKHPYVYTQCQAIHARSLLPCMDTPGVKSTYSASVTAPDWCTILMSALADSDAKPVNTGNDCKVHKWNQPVPTPAYLIALVGGDIVSRDISNRCRIWSEPSMVDAAAFDFSKTEEYLQAAESLTTPYAWTRYDVLCLPPSFPYGGMENPCLTFVTPTLLTGDKSLADVIIHEISHSWFGNLVTNETWNHFWLNEGWTMWLQRKIEEKVKGGKDHFDLSAQIGLSHLKDDIDFMTNNDHPEYTELVCPLGDGDPDDSFSSVPYEKGFNTLYYLERTVGRENFEAFAVAYIKKFQYSTTTSDRFKDFFCSYFQGASSPLSAEKKKEVDALDWKALYHTQGMPPFAPTFKNALSDVSNALADKWIAHIAKMSAQKKHSNEKNYDAADFSSADMEGWNHQQVLNFFDKLFGAIDEKTISLNEDIINLLDQMYSFTASVNSEIKFKWQTLCIKCEVEWIIPHVVSFMTSAGRMKFARPLYRMLGASKMGAVIAQSTFKKFCSTYHPIARKMITQDLSNSGPDPTNNIKFILCSLILPVLALFTTHAG